MSRSMNSGSAVIHGQEGFVLVVGLLVLLVMTVIGVSAIRSALLEERMTGNAADSNAAFQAAEAALRDGEQQAQQATLPAFDGTNGFYQAGNPANPPLWSSINWQSSTAVRTYSGMTGAPGNLPRVQSKYFLEQMPFIPSDSLSTDSPIDDQGLFRITARSVGAGGTAVVVLQSTFKR